MERVFLAKACVLSWLCLSPRLRLAQTNDPFRRFIRFTIGLTGRSIRSSGRRTPRLRQANDKPTNCGIGGHLRIIVNQGTEGAGIPKGGTVTVKLPKDIPCPHGGFYDAIRVYILVANFDAFEPLLNAPQKTVRLPDWDYGKYSPCAGCWVGKSSSDYGHDAGPVARIHDRSQDPATAALDVRTTGRRCSISTSRTSMTRTAGGMDRRRQTTRFMGSTLARRFRRPPHSIPDGRQLVALSRHSPRRTPRVTRPAEGPPT